MGDSGSLIIGMFLYVLTAELIEYPADRLDAFWVNISNPVFAIAVLIYPLTDTLRVFVIRAIKGQSPFSADRNHLHHRLIDCGYSHANTVIIIYLFSIITVGVSLLSYYLNTSLSLLTVMACSGLFILWVLITHKVKSKKVEE